MGYSSIIMDNIFDIDDTTYCVFSTVDDMKTMKSLLSVSKRCYKIYSQLRREDIKNKVVRKYWRNNINETRPTYNYLLNFSRLHHINTSDTLDLYLANLYNDKTLQKKLIDTVARFIFDKDCTCLILGGYGMGKSFLRELIAPLTGFNRYNVQNIGSTEENVIKESRRRYVICSNVNRFTEEDLHYLTERSKEFGNRKYIIEAEGIACDLDNSTALITLTKPQSGRWAWDYQNLIENELFSVVVNS